MANRKSGDAYRKLIKVMLVLLVLLVLVGTGYVLLDKYVKGQVETERIAVQEENDKLQAEYDAALAEQRREAQSSVVKNDQWPAPKETGWDVIDVSAFALTRTREVSVTRAEMLTGGLMLLNRWHALPSDFDETAVVSVGSTTSYRVPVNNSSVRLFPVAITALDEMLAAAKTAGQEHYIVREGYRTMETQTGYWNTRVEQLQERFSGDTLTEKARETVSYPGTSDYQSGLSCSMDVYDKEDSVLNNADFQTTEQAKWLNENGWQYGFIFRYPTQNYPYEGVTDKTYKTGMNPKLHMDVYRYVGKAHAAVMYHLDLCLEEYIEYMAAHPHIAVYQDGALKYEIFRTDGGYADTTIDIPQGAKSYVASSDNMGGIICAVDY